jgi:hypothetical protein
VAITVITGGLAVSLYAAGGPADEGSITDQALQQRIADLRAMSRADRHAELKSMTPEERRGLWIQLKKDQATNRGVNPEDYSSMSGFEVTQTPPELNKAMGTIAYDSGFPSTGFGGGALVGNRFDSHTGIPVLTSGTVSTIQALVVPGPAPTGSSAGFVLLGPQTGGGGAFAIFSSFTTASGVIDTVSFTGIGANYTGSSFFVLFGDFASSFIPVFGTATTLGQGHHGVVGYTGGMGPNITGTFDFGGALNAFIRATGNIVPVELMAFDVE